MPSRVFPDPFAPIKMNDFVRLENRVVPSLLEGSSRVHGDELFVIAIACTPFMSLYLLLTTLSIVETV